MLSRSLEKFNFHQVDSFFIISDRLAFLPLSTPRIRRDKPISSSSSSAKAEDPIPSFLRRREMNWNSSLFLGFITIAFIHQIYRINRTAYKRGLCAMTMPGFAACESSLQPLGPLKFSLTWLSAEGGSSGRQALDVMHHEIATILNDKWLSQTIKFNRTPCLNHASFPPLCLPILLVTRH